MKTKIELPKIDYNNPRTQQCFCLICGTKLVEVSLGWLQCESGWLQCESEQCGEVYLPFIDENNNQCLMHRRTPFSPK